MRAFSVSVQINGSSSFPVTFAIFQITFPFTQAWNFFLRFFLMFFFLFVTYITRRLPFLQMVGEMELQIVFFYCPIGVIICSN